jgi:hypothetical protein
VPCSASRVVPGAHRVVGPGTHRGSGPREVHTTCAAPNPPSSRHPGARSPASPRHPDTQSPHSLPRLASPRIEERKGAGASSRCDTSLSPPAASSVSAGRGATEPLRRGCEWVVAGLLGSPLGGGRTSGTQAGGRSSGAQAGGAPARERISSTGHRSFPQMRGSNSGWRAGRMRVPVGSPYR